MRVLVACEFSGIVRDAFARRGHDAWSCDIEHESETPGNHIKGDALSILSDKWDLLIAHPPCTTLTNAANRWLYEDSAESTVEERLAERERAINLFLAFRDAPIDRIAIENPEPHPYVIKRVGRYQDKVRPQHFGIPESKGICLWLKNLPPLIGTVFNSRNNQSHWKMGRRKGVDRRKERSRFFPEVAEAMAEQWGGQ